MIVVLDTNVIVSGLLAPYGPCAAILRLVLSGEVSVCLDTRILCEYEQVLHRPKFGFDSENISALIEYLEWFGTSVVALPLPVSLPDPDDAPFLEVARTAGADCLVTGNTRHFPKKYRSGVQVVSPAEFLDVYASNKK